DRFELDGVGNNLDFLSAIMQHPRFREGALTTGFIAEEYPEGFEGAPASPELLRKLAMIAAFLDVDRAGRARHIGGQLSEAIPLHGNRIVLIGGRSFALSA